MFLYPPTPYSFFFFILSHIQDPPSHFFKGLLKNSPVNMPPLNKFHYKKKLHQHKIIKNFTANLIRNDFIVTTFAKAKRAQPEIELYLGKTLNYERTKANTDLSISERINENKYMTKLLVPSDVEEIGSKIINELTKRYPERSHGFTRILKLEPRLGEDKAPMSVLELVDSDYEIRFWYYAKVIARLELQKLPLDEFAEHTIKKMTQLRPNGEAVFRDAVETCKSEFFKYNPETGEVEDESIKQNLKNERVINYVPGTLLGSKKYQTRVRAEKEAVELPKSPFLKEQL